MSKRKAVSVDDLFFNKKPISEEPPTPSDGETERRNDVKPSNRQTVKTTLYLPLDLMEAVDARRYELRRQGIKVSKSDIMTAALKYVTDDLDLLAKIVT